MISQRVRGVEALFIALQAGAVALLFWGWFAVLPLLIPSFREVGANEYRNCCLAMVGGLLAANIYGFQGRLREVLYGPSFLERLPVVTRQTIWSVGALLVLLVATKDRDVSRLFLGSLIPILYVMLWVTIGVLPDFLLSVLYPDARHDNTLLIGSRERAERLRPWLERKARFGMRPVGLLCDDAEALPGGGMLPVLGRMEDVERIIAEHRVTQVMMIEYPSFPQFAKIAEPVQRSGARLLIASDLAERIGHSVNMFEDDGMQFFSLHTEPLENPLNRVLKRVLDIVVSLFAIVFILPPLAVVVWVAQRLQSPGPLIFRQVRAGIQNREFTIWKFRTMHAEEGGKRVYPAGRFFRRYSLDEFPQFVNVLRGEMSIIGPRPHLVEHNRQFAEVMKNYHLRTFVKPGITGLAQVRGFRGEAHTVDAVAHRLESDMLYLENWSLPLDIVIMLRTLWQFILPPGGAR